MLPTWVGVVVSALALLLAGANVRAADTRQRVTVTLTGCGECSKTPPALTLLDESQDKEIHPTVSAQNSNRFTISLPPGYYRVLLRAGSCEGDRYLGVLPKHDRPFDIAMRCAKPGRYTIRLVDAMRGLAGTLPQSVQSIAMHPASGENAISATISDGAYYFDESICGECVLDLTLANGKHSRIGLMVSDGDNFTLTRNDLTFAAVLIGVSVRGSPFNAPEQLVEGPSGSIWALDRLGNRVAVVRPGEPYREYDLPTPYADAADIIGTPQYVWVSERRVGKLVRFAYDGSFAEYEVKRRGGDLGYHSQNFRMALGQDGRVWYISDQVVGAIDNQGEATAYTDGGPVFWLRGLSQGSDGRMWVVGLSAPSLDGASFIAAIDTKGNWQRFPLVHDSAVILAGKSGFWVVGDYDFLSYVDLHGHETPVVLQIANMRPKLYAVDATDYVWLSDQYGNIIARATPSGGVTTTYTEYGPAGISDMQIDRGGNAWIAEPAARAIEEYKKGFEASPPGIRPRRLLVDSAGDLWYSDEAADVIGVITKSGGNTCYALPLAHVRNCDFHRIDAIMSAEP